MARRVDPIDVSFNKYSAMLEILIKNDTEDIDGGSSNTCILILKESMKMARKAMKKMVMKKPLRATKRKNNNEQMTSVLSLLMIDVGADPKVDDVFTKFMFPYACWTVHVRCTHKELPPCAKNKLWVPSDAIRG